MSGHGTLTELLARARRRSITHLALDGLLLAAAAAFAAAVVVLLAGTQYLGAYWIAIGALAGIAGGVYFVRRRTPSTYVIAQRIDRKLSLADTLSTAAYFSSSEGPKAPAPDPIVRGAQFRQAEQVAQSVDLKLALPLRRPQALYVASGLALAALGVFLLKFAVTGSFDPKTSLVKTALEAMKSAQPEAAKLQTGQGDKQGDGPLDRDQNKNNDFAGDPSSEPNPSADQAQADSKDQAQNADAQKDEKSDSQGNQQGTPQASEDQQQEGNPQNGNQSAKQNQDPSLLDKVKQALSDMLNKMKSQAGDSKNQQSKGQQQAQNKQQSGQQDQNQGDNAEGQNESDQSSDSQDQSNNAANKESRDQQNGAGDQEGDKAQRQAEAMKAMGKISELLGKRAENVTGAVMVEVGTTKQQMKTPVAQRSANHAEAGSEIHRDEVPPMYEEFVQQYFEQIRKTPAATAKAAPAKPAASGAQ